MAGKRKKKETATEVTPIPSDAAAPRAKSAAKSTELAAKPAKADAPRGEPIRPPETPGKVPAIRADIAPSGDALAVTDREQQIREQAYHIWKRAGEPHGLQDEHWTLAEKRLQSK
jgi:hypothetical protein